MIEIVPYDPNWIELYNQESNKIRLALGESILSIHHFGSTSIVGLSAKPKIDIMIVVESFLTFDPSALVALNYVNRGEVIPSGRYFSKDTPHKYHVHVFEQGNPLITKNLTFRNWLRTHDKDREEYEKLKIKLSQIHTDGMKYCSDKTDFISKILKKANQSS